MAAKQTGVTIRVISNKLPSLPSEIRADVADEVKKATFGIEAAAKAKVPVLTGTLRRSIHSVFEDGGMTGIVGPSVDYGLYVEMGTRRMAARPYMRPAAEAVFPKFVDSIKALLRGLP